MDGRKAPHLRELCLETSRSLREMSLTALAKRIPLFSSEVPSLQRLALCCDVPPVEFGPNLALPPSMFPGLSELELTKMGELDHSLCLRMLYGLPNLRILKVMDVKFGAAVVARRSQRVVLESLEELTLEDSNILMLEPLLRSLSTPNLRLLSCIKVESFQFFSSSMKKNLSNLRKLNLQCMQLSAAVEGSKSKWMWKLYSFMPELTSVHVDSASHGLTAPLMQCGGPRGSRIQRSENKRALLPALSEISASGFAGNEIVKLVEARRDQGVPVKAVCIDRSSVSSGVVSFKHWEVLRGLVDTLRWVDVDDDGLKLYY